MRFRTEIELPRGRFGISHDDKLLLLGSCFSDNVGQRLARDGFDVTYNPMGPLYNPVSLGRLVGYLIGGKTFGADDLMKDGNDVYHALDFASRYQGSDADGLVRRLNIELGSLRAAFGRASAMIVTFGSATIYSMDGTSAGAVGNCHKLPSTLFTRQQLPVDEIVRTWSPLIDELSARGKRVIMTVSPIRHLADGLHGNQLSKARLLLSCDALSHKADYFPAYEIMLDDLRDYRFYAADMKHPSEVAADYIYEKFADTYFSAKTAEEARRRRDETLRTAHRPIIS